MPAAQLVSASIERIINHLLKLDSDSKAALAKLKGKRLTVKLREFPWPLTFVFSDKVDVLVNESFDNQSQKEQANISLQDTASANQDCRIELSFSALQTIQDSSQITGLIQRNELKLDGDLSVAQGFGDLIKNIDIDWEEQLSKYTGDVIAHSVFNAGKQAARKINKHTKALLTILSEGAIEEKNIAAHKLLVEDFCSDVNQLRSATERLEARLTLLEKQRLKTT